MSQVDEIKQRIDIVDLVSQFVSLKRAGRGYTGLCPFHSERTPSFHVDPSRQSWHCFGACGTGGDIFSFMMKKDGIEFRDALALLADRAGLTLERHRDAQEDARRGRLFEMNEAAAAYFHAQLQSPAQGADTARAYIEERAIARSSVERFQLGYAPNTWDALLGHLGERGFTPAEVVGAGLAVEGERGAYDRFRHRLMFPIRDDRGRVAGFGGRMLPGEALGSGGSGSPQPKYVNTSQSAIFDKGAILYALDLAKDAIRSESRAVIVEGYMDAIAAHEHGFANVVASMGTALTERQVALLKRHAPVFVLALDEDAAGIEATLRSGYEIVNNNLARKPVPNSRGVVRQELSAEVDLRVLTMPQGRDPDDVIRNDAELWRELVEQAVPLLDYVFDHAARTHDLTTPRGQSAAAETLLPWLALTGDRIMQAHYLQRLARMVSVDEQTLRQAMRPAPRGAAPSRTAPPRPTDAGRDRREEFCLALLFRYPELRAEGTGIDPDLYGRSENRELFEAWLRWDDGGEPFENTLTADLRPQFERVNNLDLPPYTEDAFVKALRSTVWGIEQQRLRLAKRASASVLADIAKGGGANIAERARAVWQNGGPPGDSSEDEADPATAFVDDMEAGLKVHQRLLKQRRGDEPAG